MKTEGVDDLSDVIKLISDIKHKYNNSVCNFFVF